MKKIIATGLSGMVGNSIRAILKDTYEFIDISYDTGVDICDKASLESVVYSINADTVLHLAAKADVDLCEKDRNYDKKILQSLNTNTIEELIYVPDNIWMKYPTALSINVGGTINLAKVCRDAGKRLIIISTDFVFDGKVKKIYTEEDTPCPVNHYGFTKFLAEQVVRVLLENYIIVRIAYPYGTNHPVKKDFVRAIKERLDEGGSIFGVYDQIFTPTLISDIAYAIKHLIQSFSKGVIYHAVGSSFLSPYQAVCQIAKHFHKKMPIDKIEMKKYYKGKAKRPRYLLIGNEKLKKEGVFFSSFSEGLEKI